MEIVSLSLMEILLFCVALIPVMFISFFWLDIFEKASGK